MDNVTPLLRVDDRCITGPRWLALKNEMGNRCLFCRRGEDEVELEPHVVVVQGGDPKGIIMPLCAPCVTGEGNP